MLLISCVFSITSIQSKTGLFCLLILILLFMLSAIVKYLVILACLFTFLNEELLISICGYDKFLCHCSSLFPQQTLLLNREAEQPAPGRANAWGAAGQQARRSPHGCQRKEGSCTGEALWCVLFLGRDECLSASVQPLWTRGYWALLCFFWHQHCPQQTLQLVQLLF